MNNIFTQIFEAEFWSINDLIFFEHARMFINSIDWTGLFVALFDSIHLFFVINIYKRTVHYWVDISGIIFINCNMYDATYFVNSNCDISIFMYVYVCLFAHQ